MKKIQPQFNHQQNKITLLCVDVNMMQEVINLHLDWII